MPAHPAKGHAAAPHVIVDGSNLATEGRSMPSLQQLNEAVLAYMAEHPHALITVVVDATFGHRIDTKEVAEFDAAVSNNELVAPPAGAIGRGDAFVLSIANKVNATILSNDSYQEFHGEYPWLFDEGRLVGGKPVPHIGWVFVNRLPVRGPLSRKSVADAKRKGGRGGRPSAGSSAAPSSASPSESTVRVGSADASLPMPVPSAPPPGALPPGRKDAPSASRGGNRSGQAEGRAQNTGAAVPATAADDSKAAHRHGPVNDLITFLSFVEHHPVGTSVNAIVDHYSSHGAYVKIGDVIGYLPLRLMADPAPRSAREFVKVGESVTLVVETFIAAKRSIDLALPHMASVQTPPAAPAKPTRGRKAAAAESETVPVAKPARAKKAAAKAAAPSTADVPAAAATAGAVPAASAEGAPAEAPARRRGSKATPATLPPAETASATAAVPKAPRAKSAAAKATPAKAAAPRAAAPKAASTPSSKATAKAAEPAKSTKSAAKPTKASAPATATTPKSGRRGAGSPVVAAPEVVAAAPGTSARRAKKAARAAKPATAAATPATATATATATSGSEKPAADAAKPARRGRVKG